MQPWRNPNAVKPLRSVRPLARGPNINAMWESCGKLKASGCCAKCLAARTGQTEAGEVLVANSFTFNQSEYAGTMMTRLTVRHFPVQSGSERISDGPQQHPFDPTGSEAVSG